MAECKVCDPPEDCIHVLPPPAERPEMVCTCYGTDRDKWCPRHGKHYTQEQREALQEAAVAMQGTEMRESVRKVIERSMGIEIDTYKDVCSICGGRGLWVDDAPLPLVCGPCAAEAATA